MVTENELLKLREVFLRVFNVYQEISKKPHSFGTEVILYSSEIIVVESIGYKPGVSVTDLANSHGVTKGAISQTIKKLEKKELIEKRKERDNREIALYLSRKGEKIFHQHKLYEIEFAEELFTMFQTMTRNEYDILTRYLSKMDTLFRKAMDEM